MYYSIIIVNLQNVLIIVCGHLQGGVSMKDILQRQIDQNKNIKF